MEILSQISSSQKIRLTLSRADQAKNSEPGLQILSGKWYEKIHFKLTIIWRSIDFSFHIFEFLLVCISTSYNVQDDKTQIECSGNGITSAPFTLRTHHTGSVSLINGTNPREPVPAQILVDEGATISVRCLAEGWNPEPNTEIINGNRLTYFWIIFSNLPLRCFLE